MPQSSMHRRPRWSNRRRAAVAGIGLGAALTLSPLVWAETPAGTTAPTPAPSPVVSQQSFAPLVKRVLPAVVNISVTEAAKPDQMANQLPQQFGNSPFDDMLRRFFDQQQQGEDQPFSHRFGDDADTKRIALGSGFIIDPEGHIVTNNHVVGDSTKVEVTLQDGTKYAAKIIGRDTRSDLAVLKIDADKPLPHVTFGNSDQAEIGDWVVAVGNPFGLGGTVTAGVVSARGRDIHAGGFDDFLQIDAPINRGNSGGPTFDLSGNVIGINTAIYSPNGGSVGIGFAVPSNAAQKVVAALEAHGKVERGWLGVQIQEVTPAIASSLGLGNAHGALVAVVSPNSPSAKAGLKQGDVILAFNGTDIAKLHDLPRLVAAMAPGSKASLTLWRDGHQSTVDMSVGEMPENPQVASADQDNQPGDESHADAMGLQLSALTNDVRRELHLGHEVTGVLVTQVESGSVADNLGLGRGDVIVSINQQPVRTPQEAADRLKEIANSPNKTALLLLNRHGVTQYLGVEIGRNQG
ncbi:MAG TPA: DegQ family serine endoprotease [Stellaceae bacterium]|nr:DegQ family serine endoprotease [Stellaceae bacterium]